MTVRCDACGNVSRLDGLYVREPGLQRHDELHCPACHDPEVEGEPLPGWPAAVIVAGLLAYTAFFGHAVWPFLLVLLFPLLTILHELLHAIPAWLLGARVLEIHVGGGKRPSWRIGGVRVALTNWLVGGGHCAYAFRRAPVPLWRHLVIIGTPLAFHLASAALLLVIGLPGEGEATVLHVFALVNGFIFLENVYPSGWSDGHQLVRLIRRGRTWADARSFRTLAGPAFHELEEGNREAAVREARVAERWMPHPALGDSLFRAYLAAGAYDDAERMLPHAGYADEPVPERALAHGHVSGEDARRLARVTLRVHQDRLEEAVADLEAWQPERGEVRTMARGHQALVLLELGRVDDADRAGREAFSDMPWLPLVKLVYGAVLIAKGACAGGVEQLRDLDDPRAAAWRAIGLAGLERKDEAKEALAKARAGIGAPARLLARATEAVRAG